MRGRKGKEAEGRNARERKRERNRGGGEKREGSESMRQSGR